MITIVTFLTARPLASRWADAGIGSNRVDTSCSGSTRTGGALVDVDATIGSCKAGGTLAPEPVDIVDTATTVVARLGATLIYVSLASRPLKSLSTHARVEVTVVDASGSVQARTGHAGLHLGCNKDVTIGVLWSQ